MWGGGMKTPKWTKADARRAEKMGWRLFTDAWRETIWIERHGDRFKSNDEAIEQVCNWHRLGPSVTLDEDEFDTIDKAARLCMKG
jgi:hypothetical protein